MTHLKRTCTLSKIYPRTIIMHTLRNILWHQTCCKTTSQSASKLRAAVSLLLVSTWSFQVMSLFEKQKGWTSRHVKSNHPNNENSSNHIKYIKTIVSTIARVSYQMLVLALKTHDGIPFVSMKQLLLPSVSLENNHSKGLTTFLSDFGGLQAVSLDIPKSRSRHMSHFEAKRLPVNPTNVHKTASAMEST